jgi:hypothetical protein
LGREVRTIVLDIRAMRIGVSEQWHRSCVLSMNLVGSGGPLHLTRFNSQTRLALRHYTVD